MCSQIQSLQCSSQELGTLQVHSRICCKHFALADCYITLSDVVTHTIRLPMPISVLASCWQVLGGQLADKYGGKRVLASGVALWSLFTLLTPQAAAMGTAPLLAARVLLGVGEGIAFPAIHSMIARNVPQVHLCLCAYVRVSVCVLLYEVSVKTEHHVQQFGKPLNCVCIS